MAEQHRSVILVSVDQPHPCASSLSEAKMYVKVEEDIHISVMNSVWQVIHQQQPGNIGKLNCLANRWMAATEEGNDILKCARCPSYHTENLHPAR